MAKVGKGHLAVCEAPAVPALNALPSWRREGGWGSKACGWQSQCQTLNRGWGGSASYLPEDDLVALPPWALQRGLRGHQHDVVALGRHQWD